jgi:hypothetical protein
MHSLRCALCFALPVLALAACSSDSPRTAQQGSSYATPVSPTVTPIQPPSSSAQATAPGAIAGTSTPGGPTKMTPTEIQSMLANNTATGVSRSGSAYYAWFSPSGQVRFVEGEVRDTGTWRILPDGQLCTQMARLNAGQDQCYSIYREGQVLTYDRPDGTTIGTFSVLSGNPQNL